VIDAVTRVRAPGRVNLIGDHTDYTGGLVLPMAIDRWTEIVGTPGGGRIRLSSADEPEMADLQLPVNEPELAAPAWARYVAGVAAELDSADGFRGHITTDIPIGAGLSSSAALEVATALALGFSGTAVDLALLCQRAEQRASGVPSGIMDQLVISAAVPGHALLIDCHSLDVEPVAMPDGVEVVVVFVAHRTLVGSAYAQRVAECAAAESEIGPLRLASTADAARIGDPVMRMRAIHVTSENDRVRAFATAFRDGDVVEAGRLMTAGHASLRDDFGTSTAAMDDAVRDLCDVPGVYGARMTGGGFGGCVVALTRPGVLAERWRSSWLVHAVGAAERVAGTGPR
jgi:galactokinase